MWSGGNKGVVQYIRESDLIDLSLQNHGPGYFRAGNCSTPHTLWNNTESVWPTAPPEAAAPDPASSRTCNRAPRVPGEAGHDGRPVMDGVNSVSGTGTRRAGPTCARRRAAAQPRAMASRSSANNVVFLVLEYQLTPWAPAARKAQTIGSGQVFVFTGGTVQTGTWSASTAPIRSR